MRKERGERLKVCTVGAGYFSQFHHEAWARMPGVHLSAICDHDREKAEAMARLHHVPAVYTDPGEMLVRERPDLFDIITPPPTHAGLVALAAEARTATICQKAFCTSLDEARQAVARAEDAGILLVVHENFRFSPWYRELHRLMDEGAVGGVHQAHFRLRPGDGRGADAYLSRQPYFQTMERFLVHETAIHLIDVFRFLFGEPASVYADLRRLNPAIAGEDAGLILMNFGKTRAVFDGNRLLDHPAQNRRLTMGELLVEGERETVHLSGDGVLSRRAFGENVWEPHVYPCPITGFAGDAVHALQAHVVAHLLDGTMVENTGRDYLKNLAVEDAVYTAAAEGRRISL